MRSPITPADDVRPRGSGWALRCGAVVALMALGAGLARAEGGPGEGADVEIGGPGSKPGQFLGLKDITFDGRNRLFVLEGKYWDGKKTRIGNCRVQVFDNGGKFLAQGSVLLEEYGDKNSPTCLAVDGHANVYVTQPTVGLVAQYRLSLPAEPKAGASALEFVRMYRVPHAWAVAVWPTRGRERVAVMQNRYEHNRHVAFDRVFLIDPAAGKLVAPLKLDRPIKRATDLATDGGGNLYVLADVNQIYKFDAGGKLLAVIGAGTFRRASDGGELRHAVAVDSKGYVYSQAWGKIARFSPTLKTVALKVGQFYWYDSWSPHDAPTPLAVDGNDRLWVGTTGRVARGVRHHFRPCVLRTRKDFLQGAAEGSTKRIGLDPAVSVKLPYGVAYALAPIHVDFRMKPASRQVKLLTVEYRVHDVHKKEVAGGRFRMKLTDGVEAKHLITFTPPRWGWYTIECRLLDESEFLMAVGAHVGVTPKFPGMPSLAEGESPGGWIDPPRHGFCGLRILRVNTGQGLDAIAKTAEAARKYGLTLLVQFEGADKCTPEKVREAVSRLKGRVKYWEIVNEPNFSMTPQSYAALLKRIVPLIKQIDPQARVMGPAVCGINLGWNEAVFKAGGGKLLDAISIHDYEGNESIDPGHWRWKVGALRKIMARYGLGARPIWQTERAIGGVRAWNFLGGVQAVRVTLQRDVLAALGVPGERNLHYYMNQAGYAAVPTYLWSASGPHPTALALRTREAMVLGRRFAGALDFGPNGNRMFLALRYDGDDGSTVVLRQYGNAVDLPIELGVAGAATLEVVDSFGNRRDVPVQGGKVKLTVPALPVYLRLSRGQTLLPPQIDFGRNYAADASFAYSGRTKSDPSILANGVFEVTHAGNPWGPYWTGELSAAPQTLDVTLPLPRKIDRVLLYSMRADNPHCALLDFDLQHHDGRKWVTLKEVRTPCPASDPVRTADSRANTWYMDQNFALAEFPPVVTRKLRIVARRSTLGFHPDAVAAKATGWQAGPPTLALREIEIYGPPPRVEISASLPAAAKTAAFDAMSLTLRVDNRSDAALRGRAKVVVPPGWRVRPEEVPFEVPKRSAATAKVEVTAPAKIPTGRVPLSVTLADAEGKALDAARTVLTVVPPVEVKPNWPTRIDEARQPVSERSSRQRRASRRGGRAAPNRARGSSVQAHPAG